MNLTVVLKKITTNALSHGTQLDISLGNNALRAQPGVIVIGFWHSPYLTVIPRVRVGYETEDSQRDA